MLRRWKPIMIYALRRANIVAVRRLKPGIRTGAGLLFITGGIFGFLPILGFWMIPVGVLVIATEFPRLRGPMRHWLRKERNTLTHFERHNPGAASGMGNNNNSGGK